MKVKIFTEGDSEKGFGHIVRCYALYSEFKTRNIPVELIIEGNDDTAELINKNDYKLINWTNNLKYVKKTLSETQCAIFDSYNINKEFCNEIINSVKVPVFIDFIKRIEYEGGLIVDASLDPLKYTPYNVKILKGYKYAILRKDFLTNNSKKIISNNLTQILLTFGGSDPRNLTDKILNIIPSKEFEIDVIIGPGYNKSQNLKINKNIRIHTSPCAKDIVNLVLKADLAITSGGQTLFEIAKLGLPAIVIKAAENQNNNIAFFCSKGLHYAGSWNQEKLKENILEALNKFSSKEERIKSSIKLTKLIDGKGSSRVIDKILSYEK